MTAENCRSKTEDPDMHPFGLLRAAPGKDDSRKRKQKQTADQIKKTQTMPGGIA